MIFLSHREVLMLPVERQPEISKIPNDKTVPTREDRSSEKLEKIFRRKGHENFVESSLAEMFHRGPFSRRRFFRMSLWSWVAGTIDALIIFSLSCVFAFIMVGILEASLKTLIEMFQGSLELFIVGALFLQLFLYLVISRTFLGYSVGEWACGLRMGFPKERLDRFYSLKVLLRTSLVFGTGIVTLPLLSLAMKKDLAGKLSGIHLVSLK